MIVTKVIVIAMGKAMGSAMPQELLTLKVPKRRKAPVERVNQTDKHHKEPNSSN